LRHAGARVRLEARNAVAIRGDVRVRRGSRHKLVILECGEYFIDCIRSQSSAHEKPLVAGPAVT
jgi:hypothetical protein